MIDEVTMNDFLPLLLNQCLHAACTPLEYSDVPPERAITGDPRVGTAVLGSFGGRTVGIWEISPSVSTDVEVDELFVVISGEAVVRFEDGTPSLILQPGCVGRLLAGSATTWSVSQTLRKIYIA